MEKTLWVRTPTYLFGGHNSTHNRDQGSQHSFLYYFLPVRVLKVSYVLFTTGEGNSLCLQARLNTSSPRPMSSHPAVEALPPTPALLSHRGRSVVIYSRSGAALELKYTPELCQADSTNKCGGNAILFPRAPHLGPHSISQKRGDVVLF